MHALVKMPLRLRLPRKETLGHLLLPPSLLPGCVKIIKFLLECSIGWTALFVSTTSRIGFPSAIMGSCLIIESTHFRPMHTHHQTRPDSLIPSGCRFSIPSYKKQLGSRTQSRCALPFSARHFGLGPATDVSKDRV
jgi:hypothetical protein